MKTSSGHIHPIYFNLCEVCSLLSIPFANLKHASCFLYMCKIAKMRKNQGADQNFFSIENLKINDKIVI